MKKYVREPKDPLPLFTQRPEGIREEKAFACGECGSVYSTKESAIYCCKQSVCEDCGNDCDKSWIRCRDCSDKIRLEKAVEIKDYSGPVYYKEADKYFESYEEALDWFNDYPEECPEWFFPCIEEPCPKLDLDSAIENLTENLFEDAYDQLKGVEEIKIAVDEFNKKQTLMSWKVDMKRKIRFVK
jgi:hypothetical protein